MFILKMILNVFCKIKTQPLKMSGAIIKTGATTVLLGNRHYEGHFGYKPNKLLKVTKVDEGHDEFKNMPFVRAIKNYKDYYIIPDQEITKILPDSDFYNYLKILVKNYDLKIFDDTLYCCYVDYGGSMDVMDSLMCFSPRIWSSAKAILKFSDQIMTGLKFLHEIEIAHLDIKPENIVINICNLTFKIIDFGYSSKYPFDDFVNNIRGTPCYFPKDIKSGSDLGLPKIDANDLEQYRGKIPMDTDRTLVYKIDSYCLGRTLLLVYDVYKSKSRKMFEGSSRTNIKLLLELLLEKNVHKRLTVTQILALK